MEFTEDIFKRRIAALLPATAAPRRANGNAAATATASKSAPAKSDCTDLSGLWTVTGDEPFLQEAYRLILGRECDVSGFVNYLELLRRHVPRRVIVLQLVNSDEARRRGARFTGIPGSVSIACRTASFPYLRRLAGRVLSQARDLFGRPVYARFDSIDHKLNFLLHDVTAKADQLSSKTDEALWTFSKKMESHVADLLGEQAALRSRIVALEGKLSAADAGFRSMNAVIARTPGVRITLEFAPARLKQSGVDPGAFLDEIGALGFTFRRVQQRTGEAAEVSAEELLAASSTLLEFVRRAPGPGGRV